MSCQQSFLLLPKRTFAFLLPFIESSSPTTTTRLLKQITPRSNCTFGLPSETSFSTRHSIPNSSSRSSIPRPNVGRSYHVQILPSSNQGTKASSIATSAISRTDIHNPRYICRQCLHKQSARFMSSRSAPRSGGSKATLPTLSPSSTPATTPKKSTTPGWLSSLSIVEKPSTRLRDRQVDLIKDLLMDSVAHRKPDKAYMLFRRIVLELPIKDQIRVFQHKDMNLVQLYQSFNLPLAVSNIDDRTCAALDDIEEISRDGKAIYRGTNDHDDRTAEEVTEGRIWKEDYRRRRARISRQLPIVNSSHRLRLLQIHRYLEQELGINIAYFARVAMLVAFCARGDMSTAERLFQEFKSNPNLHVGKVMYSVMIRGYVGKNHWAQPLFRSIDPDLESTMNEGSFLSPILSSHHFRDSATGIRNNGTTQMFAAMEKFYELCASDNPTHRPTNEIYHSLVFGFATFKTDMGAAELILDHMIMTLGRPYVQVLHVMVREYARQGNIAAAERIFGMLDTYKLQPKALTCNILLNGYFQADMTGFRTAKDEKSERAEEIDWTRHRKVQKMLRYMNQHSVVWDQYTYSILVTGYGKMPGALSELQSLVHFITKPSNVKETKPNLIVLNSMIFAYLGQEKIGTATKILTGMVKECGERAVLAVFNQLKSTPDELARQWMVPHRGTFHAVMLAYAEHRRDVKSMERILSLMGRLAQEFERLGGQLLNREQAEQEANLKRSGKKHSKRLRRILEQRASGTHPVLLLAKSLEANYITSQIMLVGYLAAGEMAKAEQILEILTRFSSSWPSSLYGDGMNKSMTVAEMATRLTMRNESGMNALIRSTKMLIEKESQASRSISDSVQEEYETLSTVAESGNDDDGNDGEGQGGLDGGEMAKEETQSLSRDEDDEEKEIDVLAMAEKLKVARCSLPTFVDSSEDGP